MARRKPVLVYPNDEKRNIAPLRPASNSPQQSKTIGLDASHNYLEVMATEETPVAIATFHGLQHIITFANPLMCRIWGRGHDEVINKPHFEAIPELAGQGYEPLLSGVLETGIPFIGNELSARIKEETAYFSFVFNPLRDKAGDVNGIMVIANEVTAKVLAQRNIKAEREALLAFARAKDEFIALASHQLRTPATAVKQYMGMLLEDYAGVLGPKQREFVEKANASNERQLAIINDLLKVAQIDIGIVKLQKEKTDLITLAASVVREQSPSFHIQNQRLELEYKKDSLLVTVDPIKIRMVLAHLIDNAGKYTPVEKHICITIKGLKNAVKITIVDQGVGIEKKTSKKYSASFTGSIIRFRCPPEVRV